VQDEDVVCAACGRRGTAADVAMGWSLAVPPRPTGAQQEERTAATARVTALCPDCLRRSVRDVEARLDPEP
jgi:hypothetical protein